MARRTARDHGSPLRHARVRAFAKINLDLRVLSKRPDGYHELRTIFQTVSLADNIDIAFTPGRKTAIGLEDRLGIPDNLMVRAARLALEAMGKTGRVSMRLEKHIPMGAGMGGGSSDAATVLLALPVLVGRRLELPNLIDIARQVGSDVPFFLVGGTAIGIGRGEELFPLPDGAARSGLIVAPGVHVNTAQAYRDLSPRLTSESQENKIFSFQSQVWERGVGAPSVNDFETIVFEQYPRLAEIKSRLIAAGASAALMTGSGSAVFGLFPGRHAISAAARALEGERVIRISQVSRARYRRTWWRALEEHIIGRTWPPQSRYAR
ncbi:MAG TPA: 4-(cytidine 5'-diphospho)-2-C-methyl-D-erythritol kinase [Bryobacteraceae bacterium]|nr:4-(cytidine 5'-diphospho)-2-C-methyl-D-erythritol kinase [Bryobacteraceae bacterium]